MKKFILFLTIFIICIIVIQSILAELNNCKNLVLAELEGKLTKTQQESLYNYSNDNSSIKNISIYTNYYANLKTSGRNYEKVSVYQTDGRFIDSSNLKIIKGRFLWDKDIAEQKNFIVIDREIAITLYSTIDCIGESIEIDEKIYSVLGVCERKRGFINTFSYIDRHSAYIPLIANGETDRKYIISILNTKNSASIQKNTIKKDLEIMTGGSVNVEDIDIRAREGIQKANLIYIVILLLIAFPIVRYYINQYKIFYVQFKTELKNNYINQAITLYKKKIIYLCCMLIVFAFFLYLFCTWIEFEFIIDPAIIPSRIIDLEEVTVKLLDYIIKENTEVYIISYYHSMVEHSNNTLNYMGIILIICTSKLLKCMGNGLLAISKNNLAK